MIASANASQTAGFIGVSCAAAIASPGAPASPLLKCSSIAQCRVAANNASQSRSRSLACSNDCGSHADWKPCRNCPDCGASPAHTMLAPGAAGRSSETTIPGAHLRNEASQKLWAGTARSSGLEMKLKSCGDAAIQSKNERQTALACA